MLVTDLARHEPVQIGGLEQIPGDTAEHALCERPATIGAGDDEIRLLPQRVADQIRTDALLRLGQMRVARCYAMPLQVINDCFEPRGFHLIAYTDNDDLVGPDQDRQCRMEGASRLRAILPPNDNPGKAVCRLAFAQPQHGSARVERKRRGFRNDVAIARGNAGDEEIGRQEVIDQHGRRVADARAPFGIHRSG